MALNGNGSRGGGTENFKTDTPVRNPQLDAAYRAGATDGPPAALDDAIRAAARRAVGARPGMPRSSVSRWRLPLSVAAVLVLSVSLVTLMREEGYDRLPDDDSPPSRIATPVAKPASEGKPLPETGSPVALQSQVAPPGSSPLSPVPRKPAAALPAPSASAEHPVAMEKRLAAPEAAATPPAGATRSAVAGAGMPPLAEGRNAVEAAAPARAEGVSPPAPRPQAFAPSALSDRAADMQSALQHRSAAAVAREERPPVAAAAERMQERQRLRSAPLEAASAVPAAPASLWSGLVDAPADDWFTRIRELRRAGRDADAGAVLAEFRRRFPDVELPQDLLPESGR